MKLGLGGAAGILAFEAALAADKKFSDFADFSVSGGAISGVGLQDADNVKFPLASEYISSGNLSGMQVDIALPTTYSFFLLLYHGLTFSISDSLALRMSSDGGVTYHSTVGDYLNGGSSTPGSSFQARWQGGVVGFGVIESDNQTQFFINFAVGTNDAGSVTNSCSILGLGISSSGNGSGNPPVSSMDFVSAYMSENNYAVQDHVRFSPFFGDGVSMNSGKYILSGVR